MAVYLLSVGPNTSLETLVRGTTSQSASSSIVNVLVDLTTTGVTDNGTTRTIKKEEVLQCLEQCIESLVRGNWPPA